MRNYLLQLLIVITPGIIFELPADITPYKLTAKLLLPSDTISLTAVKNTPLDGLFTSDLFTVPEFSTTAICNTTGYGSQ